MIPTCEYYYLEKKISHSSLNQNSHTKKKQKGKYYNKEQKKFLLKMKTSNMKNVILMIDEDDKQKRLSYSVLLTYLKQKKLTRAQTISKIRKKSSFFKSKKKIISIPYINHCVLNV